MTDDSLENMIKELVAAINSQSSIGSDGLRAAMFPDDLIAAIHNHLGNAYQLISSAAEAFNGTEQSFAYKSAQRELSDLSNSLFMAQQNDLLSEAVFLSLNSKVRAIIDKISSLMDTEYL